MFYVKYLEKYNSVLYKCLWKKMLYVKYMENYRTGYINYINAEPQLNCMVLCDCVILNFVFLFFLC